MNFVDLRAGRSPASAAMFSGMAATPIRNAGSAVARRKT